MAQTLNSFFSNIVTNLKIPEYKDYDISFNENVSDPIIKLILKYRNHPSILTIGEVCKSKLNKQPLFSFSKVTKNEIVNELLSLDTCKASQDSDIPTKILIENSDIFAELLFANYNALQTPSVLKLADITPVFKKGDKECKENYRRVSILSNVSKVFKELFLGKYRIIWNPSYQNTSVVLEKVIARSIAFYLC